MENGSVFRCTEGKKHNPYRPPYPPASKSTKSGGWSEVLIEIGGERRLDGGAEVVAVEIGPLRVPLVSHRPCGTVRRQSNRCIGKEWDRHAVRELRIIRMSEMRTGFYDFHHTPSPSGAVAKMRRRERQQSTERNRVPNQPPSKDASSVRNHTQVEWCLSEKPKIRSLSSWHISGFVN